MKYQGSQMISIENKAGNEPNLFDKDHSYRRDDSKRCSRLLDFPILPSFLTTQIPLLTTTI